MAVVFILRVFGNINQCLDQSFKNRLICFAVDTNLVKSRLDILTKIIGFDQHTNFSVFDANGFGNLFSGNFTDDNAQKIYAGNCSRRIIDAGRKSFERDVHDLPDAEANVLLDCAIAVDAEQIVYFVFGFIRYVLFKILPVAGQRNESRAFADKSARCRIPF